MEQLKQDLINILDNGAENKEAIKKALELEELNNKGQIKLNAELIEIFELLALIEAGEPVENKVLKAINQAMEQKKESFINFIERLNYFNDEDEISKVEAVIYDKGIYLQFESTRNNLNIFVNKLGQVIRKPVKVYEIEKVYLNRLKLKVN